MAEDTGGGGSSDVLFIVLILFVIGLGWVAAGGPERADVRSLFIRASFESAGTEGLLEADDQSLRDEVGETTGETTKMREALAQISSAAASPYKGKAYLFAENAGHEDPAQEYVVIRADRDNAARIPITGWILESPLTGRSAVIGNAAETLVLGHIEEGALYLEPGDSVIVATGRSPVGASFRTNVCIGYLNQFQSFEPRLEETCPAAKGEEQYASSRDLGEACYDYLDTFPRCKLELSLPEYLSSSCRDFVLENLTYNGCVKNHRGDSTFAKDEWRVFLNRSGELWKERFEVITLLDGQRGLVDTATY